MSKKLNKQVDSSNELYKLLPTVIIEKYFDKCEFDDECDVCSEPQHGTFAVGYTNDECGEEVDSYICGKCASKTIPLIIQQEKELEAHIEKSNKEFEENPPKLTGEQLPFV